MIFRSAQMAQFPLPSPQTLRDFYDIIVGRVNRVWRAASLAISFIA
jgi:hypothetical protein